MCHQDFFERSDTVAMINRLRPLHEKIADPTTPCEVGFVHSYGVDLDEAWAWLERFQSTDDLQDVLNAWNLYHRVCWCVLKNV